MQHDWRPEIVRMVQIKQAISDADSNGLWEFHLPRVGATSEALRVLQEDLGVTLDPEHRDFLGYADGWPSFFQSVDLFGVEDLAGSPRMEIARRLLGELEPTVLEQAGLHDVELLPIAATMVDLDLFVTPVVDGVQEPPVVWLAGYEIERFPTFRDFILAMIDYNHRELLTLRAR